ncbi:protein pasi2 isoform X2 [Rhynchophorus ferrugineus]|uniref:protein pasi2 isoform X2 n=1 Tax=Rhynchophorus ferrugineus TaxID=354439 RepID=UPI003FCDF1C7
MVRSTSGTPSVYSHVTTRSSANLRSSRSLKSLKTPWYRKPLVQDAFFLDVQRASMITAVFSLLLSIFTVITACFDLYCYVMAAPGSTHYGYYVISYQFVYVGSRHDGHHAVPERFNSPISSGLPAYDAPQHSIDDAGSITTKSTITTQMAPIAVIDIPSQSPSFIMELPSSVSKYTDLSSLSGGLYSQATTIEAGPSRNVSIEHPHF